MVYYGPEIIGHRANLQGRTFIQTHSGLLLAIKLAALVDFIHKNASYLIFIRPGSRYFDRMGRCVYSVSEYTQYILKIDKTSRNVAFFFCLQLRALLSHIATFCCAFSPRQLPRTHFHFSFFSPTPPLARLTPALTEAGDERPV